jgi:glycosyltransferase involved in cell wall biosynthesis
VLAYRRPLQLWRYTHALERQLDNIDVFVARSEFSQRKHAEFGFPKPMQVLPYFVPGAMPEHVARGSARPHERPYFLFVGRLTRMKGLDSVIPAFARYPAADFLIIGDGEEASALRAQAEHVGNVEFIGRVDNEKLPPYYEHAIAVIAPSMGYETFGIVLIEAFREHTPVIARNLGSFPEIVEQAGGGVLFSNEEELIAALERLQQDTEYRDRLAARAYDACRARWSEDVVVDRFLEIVDEAIAARSRPAAVTSAAAWPSR